MLTRPDGRKSNNLDDLAADNKESSQIREAVRTTRLISQSLTDTNTSPLADVATLSQRETPTSIKESSPDAIRNRKYQQVFGKDEGSTFDLYDPDQLQAYENPEWQAWRFASALLMPQHCFRRAIEHNWNKRQLRDGFDVNRAYVEKRIRELKIAKQIRNG